MTSLSELKAISDAAEKTFDEACRKHYVDGRWGAYRAFECDQEVPKEVENAMNEAHTALHAFYRKRDGEKGFLGGRGL